MRRVSKIIAVIGLIFLTFFSTVSCGPDSKSDFSITFIDVGQGDAALVSCDGHYMLIDGGPKSAGEKVRAVLENNHIEKLDYLIISHMHEDHIGGIPAAIEPLQKIGKVLSIETGDVLKNQEDGDEPEDEGDAFIELHRELLVHDNISIDIPGEGEKYSLGNAEIEIIAVGNPTVNNDSLVVLVTYGETTFLFTGDMEQEMESKIAEKHSDNFPITLLKVAHHGSDTGTEYRFVNATMPKYAVISVGAGNPYGHPSEKTLSVLEQEEARIYRTDENGTITVTSNGKELTIKTEK